MTVKLRCRFFGHNFVGESSWLEGECRQVRICERCGPVIERDHRNVVEEVIDPAKPCRIVMYCTFCKRELSVREPHDWKGWELVNVEKNLYTNQCLRCPQTAIEHRHIWKTVSKFYTREQNMNTELMECTYYERQQCICGAQREIET